MPAPYNVTFTNNVTTYMDIVTGTNNMTHGFFAVFFLIAIFIVIFISLMGQYDVKKVFAADMFVIMLASVGFYAVSLIHWGVLGFAVGLFIISMIIVFVGGD